MNQKEIEARLADKADALTVRMTAGELRALVASMSIALSTARRDGIRAGKEAAAKLRCRGCRESWPLEGTLHRPPVYSDANHSHYCEAADIRALDEAAIVASMEVK